MAMQGRMRWLAAAAIIAVMTAGCSTFKDSSSQGIDPPPIGAEEMMNGGGQAGTETNAPVSAAQSQQVTVYFKDDKGFVAPLSIQVPKKEGIAAQALEYLVDGGPAQSMLPKGFAGLIPKGTKLTVNINAEQKLATVDFSKEFSAYKAQDERKLLEAITWTLTGFSTVDKVKLRINGADLKEMPVAKTPLDSPLTRAKGINLELAPGAEIGQSTPVTVYFSNTSADGNHYFVPVTRMITRTDQVAKAAVDQLIKGPSGSKGLSQVVAPTAEVLDVKLSSDKTTVTVDFSDKILGQDKKVSADALQAVVLSVTENTGASKVQILVNGDVKVTATNNESLSKPVTRPTNINPVKM
ncbi:GerMN domain-containing protein [Paenibacillus sp. MBLB4367]|uniref:GerMN domain-containing protein n=1 Tax=Paenibacillus sp. MBLB4367 TaxID=3384767 RepID=UPI0039084571